MGTIYHKIMELYGKYLMENNQPLPKPVENNFENEIELTQLIFGFAQEAINNPKEDFSKSPLTVQMLQTQLDQITQNTIKFLKSFCKDFAGYKIKGVEKWYGGKNPDREWNYTGIVDCILVSGSENSEDMGWTIIDYKNTNSAMPKTADAIATAEGELGDFQMPMYITLLRENEKVKDISQASFYAINADPQKNHRTIVGSGRYAKSPDEYEDTIKVFEKYAADCAKAIRQSDYSLKKVDSFENCSKCNYKSICRFNFTIAGRSK